MLCRDAQSSSQDLSDKTFHELRLKTLELQELEVCICTPYHPGPPKCTSSACHAVSKVAAHMRCYGGGEGGGGHTAA